MHRAVERLDPFGLRLVADRADNLIRCTGTKVYRCCSSLENHLSKVLDKHEALEAFEGPVSFPKKQIRAHERADFMHHLKIKVY